MDVYNDETDLYILFNPWCKDDLVYLEDEAGREEYVMNDKGKVYVGAYRTPRGRHWAFGQFEDVCLPVACYILELSRLPHSERGNPVQVVRAVSAGVNSNDENGILVGKWDGEYSDGIAPYKWTGSVGILDEYVKNSFTPVRYGQCWVFSALATTICRALGIPCRSVTNFVSAHDTNSSLTIDKFFDKDGNEIEGGPDGDNWDSVWNFHVWNDVWMARQTFLMVMEDGKQLILHLKKRAIIKCSVDQHLLKLLEEVTYVWASTVHLCFLKLMQMSCTLGKTKILTGDSVG
ncbi:Hemocyte protein-glutamine gamma-glutamyltransferase [Armadillidium vulgare]|nr:Hemocyte protein-glutamine gamma-glutamyltransferase [Armadillidium vulgare]